ncbi:response regulator transcription factor [Streptomyces jumonjinensis]|uniref:response regulator transcription factor n=1 Tax=Streptomyces jumonjinensis TaxID=1945 RepID=UPI0037BDBCFE
MAVRSRHEDGLHTTRLTGTELTVLGHFARGRTRKSIARATAVTETTVSTHLTRIGGKLLASGLTAVLHAAYTGGHLPPPTPLPGVFTEAERRVWRACVAASTDTAMARALRLPPHEAKRQVDNLMKKVKALSRGHFVTLGHAYGVLTGSTVNARPQKASTSMPTRPASASAP